MPGPAVRRSGQVGLDPDIVVVLVMPGERVLNAETVDLPEIHRAGPSATARFTLMPTQSGRSRTPFAPADPAQSPCKDRAARARPDTVSPPATSRANSADSRSSLTFS